MDDTSRPFCCELHDGAGQIQILRESLHALLTIWYQGEASLEVFMEDLNLMPTQPSSLQLNGLEVASLSLTLVYYWKMDS